MKRTIRQQVYSLLKESKKYHELHDKNGFKFFNFSNIFPLGDYTPNSIKKLIEDSEPCDYINIYILKKAKNFFIIIV